LGREGGRGEGRRVGGLEGGREGGRDGTITYLRHEEHQLGDVGLVLGQADTRQVQNFLDGVEGGVEGGGGEGVRGEEAGQDTLHLGGGREGRS
jgi:hypothetical protein